MTTIDEIRQFAEGAETLSADKGYPNIDLEIKIAARSDVIRAAFWYKNVVDKSTSTLRHLQILSAPNWPTLQHKILDFIRDLPSSEELLEKQFVESLAHAIECGKAASKNVEFLNPLIETMKKLSENALTCSGA